MLDYIAIRPVIFKFHMRHNCPWCHMVDRYVVRPLELIGVAKFERVLIEFDIGGMNFSENRMLYAGKKTRAPLILLYETGDPKVRVKYFGIPDEGSMVDSVAALAKSLIKEISRLRGIKQEHIINASPILKMLLRGELR